MDRRRLLLGAQQAMFVAAAALAVVTFVGTPSPAPSAHWPAPQLTFTPDAADGPVLVTVTYRVPEDNAVAFSDAMGHVGRSRRRTGALRWELFRDGGDPTRFVESYLVGTWAGICVSTRAGSPAPTADSRSRPAATHSANRRPSTCSRHPPPSRPGGERAFVIRILACG